MSERLCGSPCRRLSALLAGVALLAPAGFILTSTNPAWADDPRGGLINRLLRIGNRRDASPNRSEAEPAKPNDPDHDHAPLGSTGRGTLGSGVGGTSPYRASGSNPYGPGAYNPLRGNPGSAAPLGMTAGSSGLGLPPSVESSGPRLVPQPRVSRPMTQADPILTRVSIGRSDDGRQFGMFLQVFADGTVLDSEGVHKVGPEAIRPIAEAIRAADLGRLEGFCGGPPTDFVEAIHLVVYDPSRGRLQANYLSCSGNTQGCDPALRNLLAAADALQMKLAPSAVSTTTTTTAPRPLDLPGGTNAPALGPSIGLTPID